MARTIPLIRAANVLPIVRWMETNHRPVEPALAAADLSYWFHLAPESPIPVHSGIRLLRDEARATGPDLGYRIVNESSIAELAYIGRVALGSRTPREAMMRVSAALPLHSSHEAIGLSHDGNHLVIRESFRMAVDPEALHAVHVLLCSMVRQLCLFTGLHEPMFERITMLPHPKYGVAHVSERFGVPVEAAREPAVSIELPATIADAEFRVIAKDRLPQLKAMRIPPLAEDSSLAGSMRPVIAAMLHDSEPTVNRVARAADMSVRSLQRRLSEEGTSFTRELDRVRQRLAQQLLLEQDATLPEIYERLAYSGQSALTRAVRRWTGTTPSWIRSQRQGSQTT